MKILVLPGTIWQIPLIKRIKAMGYEVHVANPVKNEEVCQPADGYCQSDIFDYDTIITYCKHNKIQVVMSDECDIATEAVAQINAALGARCLTPELAKLFTNKFEMREFCRKHDLFPIPYKLCRSVEEAKDFFDNLGSSAIMKPLDSNASHGVFTVKTQLDIDLHFKETMRFSRHSKGVLLEKYIEGTEFTVDGIMTPQGHVTMAISEKGHYKHNTNISNSLYFSQQNANYDYDLLRKTNDHLLNISRLPFGLTHVEYKFSTGKFYLIEMAARGGGNLISAIIAPFMSGIDNYRYMIHSALDSNYAEPIKANINNDRTAILKFFDFPYEYGTVRAIRGEDYLQSEPAIKSYRLNFGVGDCLDPPENDSSRAGYYILCANSKEECDKIARNIDERFEIVFQ